MSWTRPATIITVRNRIPAKTTNCVFPAPDATTKTIHGAIALQAVTSVVAKDMCDDIVKLQTWDRKKLADAPSIPENIQWTKSWYFSWRCHQRKFASRHNNMAGLRQSARDRIDAICLLPATYHQLPSTMTSKASQKRLTACSFAGETYYELALEKDKNDQYIWSDKKMKIFDRRIRSIFESEFKCLISLELKEEFGWDARSKSRPARIHQRGTSRKQQRFLRVKELVTKQGQIF